MDTFLRSKHQTQSLGLCDPDVLTLGASLPRPHVLHEENNWAIDRARNLGHKFPPSVSMHWESQEILSVRLHSHLCVLCVNCAWIQKYLFMSRITVSWSNRIHVCLSSWGDTTGPDAALSCAHPLPPPAHTSILPWFNGIQAFSNWTAVAWGASRCFSHWIFVELAGPWVFPLLSLAGNYYNIYDVYVFQWTLFCPRKQIGSLYFTQRAITPRAMWKGLNAIYLFLY